LSHPLEGPHLKLTLANEALDGLETEISVAMDAKPYRLVVEPNRQSGEQVVRVKIDTPPPLRWTGIAANNVAGNLRAALDQLVFQLAIANGHDPERYRTQFPIFERRDDYFQGRGKGRSWRDSMLRGVSDENRARIDALQPFAGDPVESHPLAQLRQLTDQDKHRLTPPVFAVWDGASAWFSYPGMDADLGSAAIGVNLEPSKPWVMKDDHEVFRITISTRPNPTAYFDPKTPLRVAFGEGLLALTDFRAIAEFVENVIVGFEPVFGPSPGA